MTVVTGDSKFAIAKWIVDINGLGAGATHTSISDALTDASANDTIYVKPGTYTEDLTLKSNVAIITAENALGSQRTKIIGKISSNSATSNLIQGFWIGTNSDYFYEDTGSNTGNIVFDNCLLGVTDNDGMNVNNANRRVILEKCEIQIADTGLKLFAITTCQDIQFRYCFSSNDEFVTAASTIAGGTLIISHSTMTGSYYITSGTSSLRIYNSKFSTINLTILTCCGSGEHKISNSYFDSGTAAAISLSNTVLISNVTINSTNANPLTGAGTIQYGSIDFINTGNGINVTTQQTAISHSYQQAIQSATTYTPLCGPTATGGALQSVASIGSSGQVLTSNGASALPTFESLGTVSSFTPTLSGSSSSGSGTYTVRVGYYSKIGNIVFAYIYLTWTAHTGTGNMNITNLPFACSSSANYFAPISVLFGSLTYTGTQVGGFLNNGTSEINLKQFSSNTAYSNIPMDTTGTVLVSATYFTD